MESLIAAAYFSGGHALAFRAQKILTTPIPEVIGSWASLAGMAHLALPPQGTTEDARGAEAVSYLEGIIGTTLRTPHLISKALVIPIVYANLD